MLMHLCFLVEVGGEADGFVSQPGYPYASRLSYPPAPIGTALSARIASDCPLRVERGGERMTSGGEGMVLIARADDEQSRKRGGRHWDCSLRAQ